MHIACLTAIYTGIAAVSTIPRSSDSDLEAILCTDAGVIPIYHSVTVLLAREGVQGYEANHSGLHPLRAVALED